MGAIPAACLVCDNSAAIEVDYRADEECVFLYMPFGDVADPYLVWPLRVKLLLHTVDWISDLKTPSAFCACPDAVESHLAHQPSDNCNGNVQASFRHDDDYRRKLEVYYETRRYITQ